MTARADKEAFLEGLGKICIRKSPRARNIRIRVSADEGVMLIVPLHLPEAMAIRFALEKKDWINKSLNKRSNIRDQLTIFDENTNFNTRQRRLSIQQHEKGTIKSVVTRDRIMIWYPNYAKADDQRIQDVIRKAILESWRLEAKNFLPRRVSELAHMHNFKYNKLTVKNTKTRWGSCSTVNNINLNLQLMRLPDRLIDYVILHELVHTIVKNHQPEFWRKLESVLPGARRIDKELNRYHLNFW